MTGLAIILAALSLSGSAQPLAHAERATTLPVICVQNLSSGGRDGDGIYYPGIRVVALERHLCWAITHWRAAMRNSHSVGGGSTTFVRYSIWALGHELTHDEQFMTGRAFDEHEADCGGVIKFQHLRIALGIKAKLSAPQIKGC